MTWNWAPTIGLTKASVDSGLPYMCGFGEQDLASIADRIRQAIDAEPVRRLRRLNLIQKVPEIQFLVPSDMDEVVRLLEAQSIVVDYDRCQVPVVFGRGA